MASYLTTASVGQFDLRRYQHRGIYMLDAVDPDLFGPTGTPRTGSQFAISQVGEPAYKRLTRTIAVPAAGATISFWIKRDTEAAWDHVFVEAHTVGDDDWTTLRDLNGHTSADTGASCPSWLGLHPFLEHYQSDDDGDGECSPTGSSGNWWAASGASEGYEQWRSTSVPMRPRASSCRSPTRATTSVQLRGRVRRRHRGLDGRRDHFVRGGRQHVRRLDGSRGSGR